LDRISLTILCGSQIVLKINSLAYFCTTDGSCGCVILYFTYKINGTAPYNSEIECYKKFDNNSKSHKDIRQLFSRISVVSIQKTKHITNPRWKQIIAGNKYLFYE
jgi:hypothetical protein